MKIVVVGATGTIGKGISDLLKKNGHQVIEASRRSSPGVNIDKPESIEQFFNEIGQVDAVICAAGHANFGAVTEMTDQGFEQGIRSKLMGQVNLVRKGTKALNKGGVLILTGGMLAYEPWPKTASVSMINAGLEGFVKGAALDIGDEKRIQVVHPPLLRETAIKMGMEPDPWPTSETVAHTYATALESDETGKAFFVDDYRPEGK